MEGFLQRCNSASAANRESGEAAADTTRSVLSAEDIEQVTRSALRSTCARATRVWNEAHAEKRVGERAVQRWVLYYKTEKAFYKPKERGAPRLLLEAELKEVMAAFQDLRKAGTAVCSRVFAAIARGVAYRHRPELQSALSGGASAGGRTALFSLSWARAEMRRQGLRVRRATTSRTVPASVIAASGPGFYSEIRATSCSKALLFNYDEFFVQLEPGQKGWTWARTATLDSGVAIRQDRLGFTAGILSAAEGRVHSVHLLWRGKTERAHAEPDHRLETTLVWQDHTGSTSSHFQTAETFERWVRRFESVVQEVRDGAEPETAPACLLLDVAPQHGPVSPKEGLAITVVKIPPKQTHVFQPADSLIIACLKQRINTAWAEWIQSCFQSGQGVQQVLSGSARERRDRMYVYMHQAVKSLGGSVARSWARCGILREVYGEPTAEPVSYDSFCRIAELAGDAPIPVDDIEEEDAPEQDLPALEGLPQPAPHAQQNQQQPQENPPQQAQEIDFVLVEVPKRRGRPPKDPNSPAEIKLRHRAQIAEKRRAPPMERFFKRHRPLSLRQLRAVD